MFLRAAAVWLGILALAVGNGALRDGVIAPRIGEVPGRAVSTVILAGLVLLVARITIRWIRPLSSAGAWNVGIFWVALTLAFEFLAGRYLFGNSWERILSDYDVTRGRIWLLVPLVTLVAPGWAWRRLRRDAAP